MWRNLLFAGTALLLAGALALAQAPTPTGQQVLGAAQYRASINQSALVTTGGTFQLLLPAISGSSGVNSIRQVLIVQNNNVTTGALSSDLCYLLQGANIVVVPGTTTLTTNITVNGGTMTAAQASSVYGAGGSYNRLFPYVPSEPLYMTCATTGDSFHVQTM